MILDWLVDLLVRRLCGSLGFVLSVPSRLHLGVELQLLLVQAPAKDFILDGWVTAVELGWAWE